MTKIYVCYLEHGEHKPSQDLLRKLAEVFDEGGKLEAFQADALHVGMDEVFLLGSEKSPSTKGQDPAKVFAKAVNDLRTLMNRGLAWLATAPRAEPVDLIDKMLDLAQQCGGFCKLRQFDDDLLAQAILGFDPDNQLRYEAPETDSTVRQVKAKEIGVGLVEVSRASGQWRTNFFRLRAGHSRG